MTMTKKTSSTSITPSTTTPAVAPEAPVPTTAPAAPPPNPTPPAPDPNAALAALALQGVAQLDAILATLGTDPPLTPLQKRHAARMRKGGEPILGSIANLATQHGLVPPAMPVDPMLTAAGKAGALQPLADRLAAVTRRVDDLIFVAQSTAWEGGMQLYALLQRKAVSDASLAAALQPVTQFFAYRHPTLKAKGTLTKPQKKATKMAVGTLQKTAPQLLAPDPAPPAPAVEAAPAAPPATPAPAAPVAPKA